MAWVLGCALAVVVLPVLYVLSVPWVYRWGVLPVELRRSYIQPYYWAAGYEPLTYYLIIYDDWCEHQLWLAYVKK